MKDILIYTYQWLLTVTYNKGYDYGKVSLNKNMTCERAQEAAYFTIRNIVGAVIYLLLCLSYGIISGPCFLNTRTFLKGSLAAFIIVFSLVMIYGYISKIYLKPVFIGILPKEVTENELKKMNTKYISLIVIFPIIFVSILICGGLITGRLERMFC